MVVEGEHLVPVGRPRSTAFQSHELFLSFKGQRADFSWLSCERRQRRTPRSKFDGNGGSTIGNCEWAGTDFPVSAYHNSGALPLFESWR